LAVLAIADEIARVFQKNEEMDNLGI